MKKTLSIILTLIMVFMTGVSVFAEEPGTVKCPLCEETFTDNAEGKAQLLTHINTHKDVEGNLTCPLCGVKYDKADALFECAMGKSIYDYICPECSEGFFLQEDMDAHAASHGITDPTIPTENPDSASGKHVADLYLCSNNSGFPSLGHIWIYIENVSGHTLTIGKYQLPPGEGVSVGTFTFTRSDGMGIYYNVESYTGNILGVRKPYATKTEMSEAQVKKVSDKILRSNFWEPIFMNCVFFACTTWMAGGGSFIFPVTTFPVFARLMIKNKPQATLNMYNPGRNRVYKQHGNGNDATLSVCVDGTVDTPPG